MFTNKNNRNNNVIDLTNQPTRKIVTLQRDGLEVVEDGKHYIFSSTQRKEKHRLRARITTPSLQRDGLEIVQRDNSKQTLERNNYVGIVEEQTTAKAYAGLQWNPATHQVHGTVNTITLDLQGDGLELMEHGECSTRNKRTETVEEFKKRRQLRTMRRRLLPKMNEERNNVVVTKVSGPNPDEPDNLVLELTKQQMNHVASQGSMLAGASCIAYMHALTRNFYHQGLRCLGDSVVSTLTNNNSGTTFHDMLQQAKNSFFPGQCYNGLDAVDWNNARGGVVLIPVFSGPRVAGHWSLLIVDQLSFTRGTVVVYFDSLPTYNRNRFNELKTMFGNRSDYPFAPSDTTAWINGGCPQQARNSNDCGVWMCCNAAAYVKAVFHRGSSFDFPPSSVKTLAVECVGSRHDGQRLAIGAKFRAHMVQTLLDDKLDLEANVLTQLDVNGAMK